MDPVGLLGKIIGVAGYALIAALMVQYATLMVAKFKPTYKIAYKVAFVGYAASLLMIYFYGFLSSAFEMLHFSSGLLVIISVGLVHTGIYGSMIKDNETKKVGYLKGFSISLVQLFITAVFGMAILIIFRMIM